MSDQIATGIITLGDDFTRHRVTGKLWHGGYIDVPLINHVEGNLWQGGCMGGVELPDGFRHVVSLYPWEQYMLPDGCERVEFKLYDSLDQATDQVDEIAALVVEFLKNGPTLVHCQAGMNRSGLVAARALMLMGDSAGEAINKLRDSRCQWVLCNSAFEDYLRGLD